MSVVTGRRLQRFWQKGIKPLKDLLGGHDIADLSEDGTVTGALSKLSTDIVAKNASLEFDSYVESTESYAIVIGNICVVSMCFSVDSFSDVWSDYGIATVIGVVSDCRINSVASIQEKGTCIDVSIDKNTDRISMNARGNVDTQTGRNWYRGVLVYPVAHQ